MSGGLLAGLAAGLPWTLGVTAGSLLIGAVLGVPLCAARRSRRALPRLAAGLAVLAVRAVPPLLWLLLAHLLTGAATPAALVGLALVVGAGMAEVYGRALAAVPAGQREAAAALGLAPPALRRDVLAPQMLPAVLPGAAALAAALLRDSAIAALIGGGGVAAAAGAAARSGVAPFTAFTSAGAAYLALGLGLAALAWRAARRLLAAAAR